MYWLKLYNLHLQSTYSWVPVPHGYCCYDEQAFTSASVTPARPPGSISNFHKRRSDGNHGCDFVVSHLANQTARCATTPDTLNSWPWCGIHNFPEGQIRCELNSEASQIIIIFFDGWLLSVELEVFSVHVCACARGERERETQSDGVQ